jgi:hypothetical protein
MIERGGARRLIDDEVDPDPTDSVGDAHRTQQHARLGFGAAHESPCFGARRQWQGQMEAARQALGGGAAADAHDPAAVVARQNAGHEPRKQARSYDRDVEFSHDAALRQSAPAQAGVAAAYFARMSL